MRPQHPSLPAILVALVAIAGLLVAGVNPWLALSVALLWGGSLWLARSGPEPAAPAAVAQAASHDAARAAIEPLSQPLLVLDADRIVLANAAARSALGAHIVGQDARIALRHPDAVRLLEAEDGASVVVAGLTRGRSVWQLTRRRVDDEHWLIELFDRTAEADIGRSHTDFVANASHELRTPLASVIGYVETLIEDPAMAPAERERFLATIDREAQRMLSLIEDLMALSRIEAEKHEQPTDRVDLAGLARAVVEEQSSSRGGARVALAEGTPAEAPMRGDRGQIEQLVRNLVDNAIKYGGADQPVEVGIAREAGEVRLRVSDRGPGIAPEHLPHLTRRFYRTDPGRSRAAGGTGLGLAIVKHIVERHRGKLDIASRPGEGTHVTIHFAAAEDTDDAR